MILTSPVFCVSDKFSLYRVSFFWIHCNCYHPTNQIRLMASLTMMGITPGPLVRALFLFCFEESVCRVDNSVGRVYCVGSGFFVPTGIRSIGDVVPLVVFVPT